MSSLSGGAEGELSCWATPSPFALRSWAHEHLTIFFNCCLYLLVWEAALPPPAWVRNDILPSLNQAGWQYPVCFHICLAFTRDQLWGAVRTKPIHDLSNIPLRLPVLGTNLVQFSLLQVVFQAWQCPTSHGFTPFLAVHLMGSWKKTVQKEAMAKFALTLFLFSGNLNVECVWYLSGKKKKPHLLSSFWYILKK